MYVKNSKKPELHIIRDSDGRIQRIIGLKAVADAVGCSMTHVRAVVTGERIPGAGLARRLAKLGVEWGVGNGEAKA